MKQIAKLFFPLYLTFDAACAADQLILIVSDDFNTTSAVLTRYEKDESGFRQTGGEVAVNLGRNGLAWGIGEKGFSPRREDPVKQEGDGRAPAGIFTVSRAFGYAPSIGTKLPYIQADKELICVDDAQSDDYNSVLRRSESDNPQSFEWMRRDDDLYKIGLVVDHNREAIKGAGSCIFFHIRKSADAPTAGCSAMREEELMTILRWLDPAKNPRVVQIPRNYCSQAGALFPGIRCSEK